MKAEPRMIRLLEKAGIMLGPNNRVPRPPSICEQWWSQAEILIKRKNKAQPKFGLGYHNIDTSDKGEDSVNANITHGFTMSTTTGDEVGCSYQPRCQQHPLEVEAVEEDGEPDVTSAPQQLEDGGQPTIDELVQINLRTEDDPRPTFVSATLTEEEQEDYRRFLMEYKDCFAWSYKEMPGLDPSVTTHKLAIDPQVRPMKQAPRRL